MLLRKEKIEVVVHIINGLPYESKKMMIDTIRYLNNLDIQGVKIHSLVILKETKIYYDYQNKPFPILELDEYVDIVCSQLRYLSTNIIVHRISADAKIDDLFLPKWATKKLVVSNEIDKYLRKNNYYQGDLL